MENQKIDLKIGLDDSEEVSYSFSDNRLIVLVKNWELKMIEINFEQVVLFIEWAQLRYLSKLYLVKSGVASTGDSLEGLEQYKLYKFTTEKGSTLMEIGCKNFGFQIFKDETAYKCSKEI